MDLKTVLELLDSVDKTGWTKFEMSEKDFSLKLERGGAGTPAAPLAAAPAEAAPEADAKLDPSGLPDAKTITSPVIGIFHPLGGGKAAKIGDSFNKGDVVCMVEAMKLMNEIHMPEDGEIVWVAPNEGDMVEYGQLLLSYITKE